MLDRWGCVGNKNYDAHKNSLKGRFAYANARIHSQIILMILNEENVNANVWKYHIFIELIR